MRIASLAASSKRRKARETAADPVSQRPILPVTALADEKARRFEDEVRSRKSREEAVIIDNETGRIVGSRIRGTRKGVRFSNKQLQEMQGRVLSHNHPEGWSHPEDDPRHAGAGFSIEDVRMMVDWGLAEVRVATPGYLYRLRPPADSDAPYNRQAALRTPESSARVIEQVFISVNIELEGQFERGDISREEADIFLNHLAMLELQRSWGLEYEREEVP